MTTNWRGRTGCEEQVANAKDSFVDLTPASDAPAAAVEEAWSAWIPGQEIPLIGERRYDGEEQAC